jgi:hypothetical protein
MWMLEIFYRCILPLHKTEEDHRRKKDVSSTAVARLLR